MTFIPPWVVATAPFRVAIKRVKTEARAMTDDLVKDILFL
jgi:hypothetical protein